MSERQVKSLPTSGERREKRKEQALESQKEQREAKVSESRTDSNKSLLDIANDARLEIGDRDILSYDAVLPPPSLYQHLKPDEFGTELNCAKGFGGVSAENITNYVEKGYLLIRNALDKSRVEKITEAVTLLADEKVEAFNEACNTTHDLGDKVDLSNGRGESVIQFEYFAKGLPKGKRGHAVRKLQGHHTFQPDLRDLSEDKDLVNLVLRLINGDDVDEKDAVSKVDILQSLALLKPPGGGREKPWHQDHAYFNIPLKSAPSGAPSTIVGMWIALDKTVHENGCMHLIPGSHKAQQNEPQIIAHFQRRDWQICDEDIKQRLKSHVLAAEMEPGDMLVFTSLIPHGTPPNMSKMKRRAVQFHFVPSQNPRCSTKDRLQTFGQEGKNVEC